MKTITYVNDIDKVTSDSTTKAQKSRFCSCDTDTNGHLQTWPVSDNETPRSARLKVGKKRTAAFYKAFLGS